MSSGPNGGQSGGIIQIGYLIGVALRRWWIIALIGTLITSAAIVLLMRATPIYSAKGLLEVRQAERNVINVSEVESVVADQEFLTTQVELLQSDTIIEDTIESMNMLDELLDAVDDAVPQSRDMRMQLAMEVFKGSLSVRSVGRSRLIQVSFEHPDPQVAADTVNTLTDVYIAGAIDRRFSATEYARDFLETRLGTVRKSLEEAERQLVSYAIANDIILVDNEAANNSSETLDGSALRTLSEQLNEATSERIAAQNNFEQSKTEAFASQFLGDDELSRLREERIKLTSEYRDKLATFRPEYPEMQELQERIALFNREIEQRAASIVGAKRAELERDFNLARMFEQDLAARVETLKNNVTDMRSKSINYNILLRQVETERAQYEALLQRLKEVSVTDNLGSNLVEIVDRARPPLEPAKPNKPLGALLAAIFSGLLGFAVAYIVDILDNRIKKPEDVKEKLSQIILGVIPVTQDSEEIVDELENPQSIIAEAYATLRTNVQHSGADGGPRVIQTTSTRSGEGKSASSLGLALRMAGVGHRVLLIDADMRRPTFLNPAASVGLSGVLTTTTDFAGAITPTKFDNMWLLPSGSHVPNPSELLASSRFDKLLAYCRKEYDYVFLDSPPVLGLADALILGGKADASLMVVEAGTQRTPNVKDSLNRLANGGAKILGVVLTKFKMQSARYDQYYNYKSASHEGPAETADIQIQLKASQSKQKFDLVS
ncbi:MAG: polysaccharide biosynthesis tyrosine autokinase [Pseudomonadota bacterium]